MASALLITNLPTPYRLPLYRCISAMLAARGDSLKLFFLGYAKSERQWRIDDGDLRGLDYAICEPGRDPAGSAIELIDAGAPSVVILSWAMDLPALRLLLYSRRRGIPCFVVSGETPASAAHNPLRRLRQLFRQPFFRHAAGFITYGIRSREYLIDSGVPEERVHTGINVVDVEYFRDRIDACRSGGAAMRERERYRDRNGEPFACHLLFVGYLRSSKGAHLAVDALAKLRRHDIALHIVGAGPWESMLRDRAAARGLGNAVIFHGYEQIADLPLYYALADALLFPSLADEVFGLVMVEGAAAGLPIIASGLAGGTADVVEDGVNGIVIDPRDIPAFARAIALIADDPALRERMGAESRRRAMERFTIDRSAARYVDAIVPYLR